MLHGLHDNGNIDFCLNLHIKASLAHIAKLVRAVRPLSLELPHIERKACRLYFMVEISSTHDMIVSCHIVLVIEGCIC